MNIQENVSLKECNTFGIDVKAQYFTRVETAEQLKKAIQSVPSLTPIYLLGGGSNVLFLEDYKGLVIQVCMKEIHITKETSDYVDISVAAGESWHGLVTWAVEQGYEGIENMAYVPGTMGGAVVGNIAAYGQNLSDVLASVEVIDMGTGTTRIIEKKDCELQYRSSRFKRDKNLVVLSAVIRLNKHVESLETSYHERKGRFGSLEEELARFATPPYTMKDVYNAVIRIRKNKLPDPSVQGTVGSYFINPTVSQEKYRELAAKISELQSYPVEDLRYTVKNWEEIKATHVKVPAGRIIDELGWRGKWEGNVGVSDKHALCIITNKKASGQEVYEFAEKIRKNVQDVYGIALESEIDIVKSPEPIKA